MVYNIKNKIAEDVTITLPGSAPATAGNYGNFYIANKKCTVQSIKAVWGTKTSDSGTLSVERLQGVEAADAGDNLLTSAIDMTGTASTVNTGTLTTTKAWLDLEAGDRLGLVDSGTKTALAGLSVTVRLIYDQPDH